MSNSQKQYPYKFETDSDVGRWMNAQKNKSRSLGFVILWAIQRFGEVDLIEASVKEAFNTETTTQSNTLDYLEPKLNTKVPEHEPQPISSKKSDSTNSDKFQALKKDTHRPDILSNMLN